jgi:hypothetical protein
MDARRNPRTGQVLQDHPDGRQQAVTQVDASDRVAAAKPGRLQQTERQKPGKMPPRTAERDLENRARFFELPDELVAVIFKPTDLGG